MTFWQLPPEALRADPPIVEVTAAGVWPLAFDLARYLPEGQVPRRPRAQLIDLTVDRAADVATPTLDGTALTVVLRDLAAGHDYRLIVTFMISADNQPSKICVVRCIA